MNKPLVEKEVLLELYETRGQPMYKIAKELGVSVGSIHKYIHSYGIKTRRSGYEVGIYKMSDEHKQKLTEINKNKVVSVETRKKMSIAKRVGGIGHKKKRSDGYVHIYFPDHPKASKDGYILEHVLVMECVIGRHLKDDEVVHHINKIRNDNRIENLQLMTNKEHASLHSKERWLEKKGGMTYQ